MVFINILYFLWKMIRNQFENECWLTDSNYPVHVFCLHWNNLLCTCKLIRVPDKKCLPWTPIEQQFTLGIIKLQFWNISIRYIQSSKLWNVSFSVFGVILQIMKCVFFGVLALNMMHYYIYDQLLSPHFKQGTYSTRKVRVIL